MSIIAAVKTAWAGWSVGWPIFKKARSGFNGWNAKRKAKKKAKQAAKAVRGRVPDCPSLPPPPPERVNGEVE